MGRPLPARQLPYVIFLCTTTCFIMFYQVPRSKFFDILSLRSRVQTSGRFFNSEAPTFWLVGNVNPRFTISNRCNSRSNQTGECQRGQIAMNSVLLAGSFLPSCLTTQDPMALHEWLIYGGPWLLLMGCLWVVWLKHS